MWGPIYLAQATADQSGGILSRQIAANPVGICRSSVTSASTSRFERQSSTGEVLPRTDESSGIASVVSGVRNH